MFTLRFFFWFRLPHALVALEVLIQQILVGLIHQAVSIEVAVAPTVPRAAVGRSLRGNWWAACSWPVG